MKAACRPLCMTLVLVDEAQFFAPIWFEIIKRIVKLIRRRGF
jgi:thymidine kinase